MGPSAYRCTVLIIVYCLILNFKEIRGISLDTNNTEELMQPLGVSSNFFGLDFYFNSSLLFYADDHTNTIGQVSRVGTDKKDVIATGLRRPQGLAVDWVAGNLFWTDAGNDVIEVFDVFCTVDRVIEMKGLHVLATLSQLNTVLTYISIHKKWNSKN